MKEFNKNHLNNINKSEKSINIIDGTDLVLSFKFSVFNLEIEHKILKEIGEFIKILKEGIEMLRMFRR